MEYEYLIWSCEHRGWWCPNRMGYTNKTELAGRFSLKEANEICRDANFDALFDPGPDEAMVPVEKKAKD